MSNVLSALSPSTANWSAPRGASASSLTAADVAAALSCIENKIQYHLMMIRGADQWPNAGEEELLVQEIQHLILVESGKSPRKLKAKYLRPLAETLWHELTHPVARPRRWEAIGVCKATWHNTCKHPYSRVHANLEQLYRTGIDKLHRQLI